MKNKALVIISFLAILMGGVACQQIEKTNTNQNGIAIIFPKDNDYNWEAEGDSLLEIFTNHGYPAYAVYGATAQEQAKLIKQAICPNTNLLIFCSINTESPEIADALSMLHQTGVKVICFDSLQRATPSIDLFIGYTHFYDVVGLLQGLALREIMAIGDTFEIISGARNDLDAATLFYRTWIMAMTPVMNGDWIINSNRSTFESTSIGEMNYKAAKTYAINLFDTFYKDSLTLKVIVTSNDLIAKAVIDVIDSIYAPTHYPFIIGNGNTPEAQKLILEGKQAITISKNRDSFFDITKNAAIALQRNESVSAIDTTNNGSIVIPTIRIVPKVISKSDIK